MTRLAPPEHWNRFVQLVKQRAPALPIEAQTALQQNRAAAGRAVTVFQSLTDGLGVGVPTPVGIAATAATSNSPEEFAHAMADTAISEGAARVAGAEAGPIVGNLIFQLRGVHQALERSDAMVTYLLGLTAYVTTLARCCVGAMRDPVPYVRFPHPVVPRYVEQQGDLFTGWRRQAFVAGAERVQGLLREVDTVRPTIGDRYSKQCLIYVGVQTEMLGQHAQDNWRLRLACERIILRDMLGTDLVRQRDQLRRWVNAP